MVMEQFRKTIAVENNEEIRLLLGKFDQHITLLDRYFKVRVIPQGNIIVVEGDRQDAENVAVLFEELDRKSVV